MICYHCCAKDILERSWFCYVGHQNINCIYYYQNMEVAVSVSLFFFCSILSNDSIIALMLRFHEYLLYLIHNSGKQPYLNMHRCMMVDGIVYAILSFWCTLMQNDYLYFEKKNKKKMEDDNESMSKKKLFIAITKNIYILANHIHKNLFDASCFVRVTIE